MERLTVPSRLGPDRLPDWLSDWAQSAGAEAVELLFPSDAFVEPGGVVLLAAGIAHRALHGKEVTVREADPNSPAVGYLRRIGFFDLLRGGPSASPSLGTSGTTFVRLRRIRDRRVALELAQEIGGFLEAQLQAAPPSVLRALRFVLEELGVNVVEHSGRPETGFGLAQAYPARNAFQLAFADCGIGFAASLRRNPELEGRVADDAVAVQLAVERGVTGIAGRRTNMGFGLPLLRDLSDRLGADLWVLSGEALWHRRTVAGQRVATTRSVPAWGGAWICLEGSVFPT